MKLSKMKKGCKQLTMLLYILAVINCCGLMAGDIFEYNKPLFEVKKVFKVGIEGEDDKGDDNYLFYRLGHLHMDSDLNLYAMDIKTGRIRIFDRKGRFKKNILGKGQGPNEISNFVRFGLNKYTGNIFVINDYGFTLKEFNKDGNFVRLHRLKKQLSHHFEFINKDRAYFIAQKGYGETDLYNFKLYDFNTGKVEAVFGKGQDEDVVINLQKFQIYDNKIWTSPCDQMKIMAYDLETLKLAREIPIPGKFKKNTIQEEEITRGQFKGGKILRSIYYNLAYPFFFKDRLMVLVTLQDFKMKGKKIDHHPVKCAAVLYMVEKGNRFVKLKEFDCKGYEGIRFGTVEKNRLVLYSNEPYAKLEVFEINELKQDENQIISLRRK